MWCVLQVHHTAAQPARETWPATWRHSTGGKVGLSLMGLAFLIATFIQLQGVFSKQWHRDYRCVRGMLSSVQHCSTTMH